MAKARREHGSGSVYEYPAGTGRWFAALASTDDAGRRHTIRRMAPTEAAAKRLLTKMRDGRDEGIDATGGQQTVARFLSSWLEVSARPRVRPSTYRRYEQIVRVHLSPPPLGRMRLEALRPEHVDRLLESRRKAGAAPKTLQHIRATLRRALNYARRQRYVSDNAASLSEPPKMEYREVHPLSVDQARGLLRAMRGDRLETLITLAIAVGLRQGEALGLKWANVDLESRAVHVRQSLTRVDGKYQLVEVKTNRAKRNGKQEAYAGDWCGEKPILVRTRAQAKKWIRTWRERRPSVGAWRIG